MAAPLFILAPPRSYTSLFNAMIGQHPEAYGLPELAPGQHLHRAFHIVRVHVFHLELGDVLKLLFRYLADRIQPRRLRAARPVAKPV